MKKTIQFKLALQALLLGSAALLVGTPDALSAPPPPSGNSATVLVIKGKNGVWVSHEGGDEGTEKRRLAVGDQVGMPCEIETGRNTRVLFDFPGEKVAVGENTKCTLEFPGDVPNVEKGTVASEKKKGATHPVNLKSGEAEAFFDDTMMILYAPPKGEGNTKILLVHGDGSFSAKDGSLERNLEPGQMVVVPEAGKGEPYCVQVDLKTAVNTSKLIQDFKGHWNKEKIQEAIDSQRGRFIRRLPYGLQRGQAIEERRLLFRRKKH